MSQELERVYTIPLGKVLLSANNHRAVRAINMIKEFARRHMKTHEIKIDEEISHIIWARGARSPPRKIRVSMVKTDEGYILVSPYQDEVDTSVKPEEDSTPEIAKKVEPEQSEEVVEVDVGEKIEEEAPNKESKPKEVEESAEDKSATKKLTDRLFWMRVVFAVIGGIIATFAFEEIEDVEEKRWTSIGFMIMLFIATAIIAKSWKIRIPNRKKYVTTGIGSFVFLYLFVWIVSHTLVNAGTSSSMIPFP